MSSQVPWVSDGNHIDPSQDTAQRGQAAALTAAMAADGVMGAKAERAAKRAEAEKQAAAEQDMRAAKERLQDQKPSDGQDRPQPEPANPAQLEAGDGNHKMKDASYNAADTQAANEWFAAARQPAGTPEREDVMKRSEDHLRKTQPDMMAKYDHYRSKGLNECDAMFDTITVTDMPGSKAPSDAAMKNATQTQTQTATQSATSQATQATTKKAAAAGAGR